MGFGQKYQIIPGTNGYGAAVMTHEVRTFLAQEATEDEKNMLSKYTEALAMRCSAIEQMSAKW
jgi:hypothetical protein